MPLFVDFSTAMEVTGSAAQFAWSNRSEVRKLLTQLINRIRHGHLRIVMFGLGGVGKTTLGKLLSGADDDELPRGYEESLTTETFALDGDLKCSILVAPGQERRETDEPRIRLTQYLSKGDAVGVINVVCYGYHHFPQLGYKHHPIYLPEMTPDEFMAIYTEERRQAEIDALERLKPFLLAAQEKIWMITLVTKQDLWWKDRNSVSKHYESETSSYAKIVEEIKRERHPRFFLHQALSASLVWNNLRDPEDTVLAMTSAGYEQNTRKANLARALKAIHDIAEQQVKK